MISFLFNDRDYSTSLPPGAVVLDMIRGEAGMTGTREGCREGDCGACTVLLGEAFEEGVSYLAVNSCILPAGELEDRHLVTIEGLTPDRNMSPVQRAFVDNGASQCGFCTPGMIVSLTGYLLSVLHPDTQGAIASLGGNICRCTGYLSVRRAADEVVRAVGSSPARFPGDTAHLGFLVERGVLPRYFADVPDRLPVLSGSAVRPGEPATVMVGGGTDIFATESGEMKDRKLTFLLRDGSLRGTRREGGRVVLGGSTTVTDLISSGVLKMGDLHRSMELVSSAQVRNRATVAGNIVNASPIGDLSIILLALDADVGIRGREGWRKTRLKDFFTGYREILMEEGEILETVSFPEPGPCDRYSFEKVSMRRHLDIASVNTACRIRSADGMIESASISAGGVAPIPLYLSRTSSWLAGRGVCEDTVLGAAEMAMDESRTIDDVRGSAEYKRLLLGRLVRAHFIKLFPECDEGGLTS